MRWWLITCVAVLTILPRAASAAGTPEENFDKLYGEQAKRTLAQRDPKAAVDFAQSLIKDAAELKDDPKFQALVFNKAHEIAFRGGAYPAAEEAMEKLAAAQPALRREADEKLLLALERDRRPEARAKLDATRARVLAVKRLAQLEQAVQKSPNKRDAADLVRMLLVEFDAPAKAAAHVAAAEDDVLKRVVQLAAKDITDLTEPEAKELGDWYQARATGASAAGRAVALGRAKGCYERFLSVHVAADASRLEVKRRLDALAKVEAVAGGSGTAGGGKWIDLLAMIDAKRDAKAGTWTLENGVLTSDKENGARVQIPYLPPEEYDYRVVFTRNQGGSGVLQYAARGDREMIWVVGYSTGFALNDKTLDQKVKLDNGRKYTSLIKVRRGGVQFLLNGQLVLEEKDENRLFQSGLWNRLPNEKLLGVGSFFSPTSFHSIEIQEISGKGNPLEK
jgi:hypothetical protein